MDKCLVVDGFSRRRHTLFQAFAGLPRTGVLDARTIEMMNTPRWLSDLIFAVYFGFTLVKTLKDRKHLSKSKILRGFTLTLTLQN